MAEAADFFVSYTSADRAWAEWIAWQLEAEGYQVVVQAWDFTPSHDWAHEMQHATATAKRVVVVLSPAYLESAHGEAEWRIFYADDPTGERGLLLVVRVEQVKPPGLLKTRVYVDLVNQGATDARRMLLAAVRGARGKPIEEPEFPGKATEPVGSGTEVPRFPGELPAIWNVPFHPNPFFTGRDLLLAELHASVAAPEVIGRRVALTGLGGVGKSQLAVEYAYRRRADFDLVWWVRAEQPTSRLADYAALASQPRLAADLGLAPDTPQETTMAAARAWLEHQQRWLLVLDNAVEPAALVDLLPRSGSGQVVITSRTGIGWEQLAIPLPVEVLDPADATEFLLARTKQSDPQAVAAASLAGTLGGLPLALEQAGAYVAASGTVTLAGYEALFATRALELLKRGQPLGYQHTVATTWSLALQRLQQSELAAVTLLTLAAFFAPDDLPQPLLVNHPDRLPEPLASATRDPLALADAVAALRRFSLVRVIGDGLYVHRLLQTVVQATLDAEAEAVWAAAAVRLLSVGFPDPRAVSTWTECERLVPHVLAVADHGRRLDVETTGWLWLLDRAGEYLWSRGRYWQALPLQEEALAGLRRALGDDHPDTLHSMHNLALTRRDLGDLQGARELFEQALTARRRVLGDDHPATLWSMQSLALVRRALGDLQVARELNEHVLTARRRILGDDHPDTLWSMHSLAVTRGALGDLQGARELHEQALAGYRQVLGDDHHSTLWSMQSLAVTRRDLGDLNGARELGEQALAGYQRVLGADHPDTLISMHNLATTRQALGDLQDAHDLLEQVLAARRRVLGEDHPDTLVSMDNLAEVRRELGEL
jgi:tetratricopeptide (TPR) repeat protein